MKKILIVSNEQFGYHTDTYKYVQNLKDKYKIYYVCIDHGYEKIVLDKINIVYIKKRSNNKMNNILLLYNSIKNIFKFKIDITFIMYFRLCNLIPIFFRRSKHILDIRTGTISSNIDIVRKGNLNIKNAAKYFNNITIISEGLLNYLDIETENKKIYILPLGADISHTNTKNKNNTFTFCYVGILSERKINDTLKAFNKFSEINRECEFIIAGYHSIDNEEKEEFFDLLKSNRKIKFLGRVKHDEINSIICKSNVGISYIPKTEYYNYQPPTKTYEYLANGIVCIATDTYENKRIINSSNGVLCLDTIESLLKAMMYVYDNVSKYNDNDIKKTIKYNSWEYICNVTLKSIFESIK